MENFKRNLIKSLRHNESLVDIDQEDILQVTRTTKGNFIPGNPQKMTVKEAVAYGAWDSVRGTMQSEVTLHPDFYEKPLTVSFNHGFVYAIDNDGTEI